MTIIEFLKFINWQLFYVRATAYSPDAGMREQSTRHTPTELNGNENFIENISPLNRLPVRDEGDEHE